MTTDAPLRIEITPLPELGAALIEAGLPALQQLTLRNTGERDLHDLTVQVEADPPFAAPLRIELSTAPAGATLHLAADYPLALDAAWLAAREEGCGGVVRASVWHGEQVIASDEASVRLHAPAHWPGLGLYPELLAAWIRPNARALIPLLARADRLLEQRTGQPGLNGYQSRDPKRAWRIAEALYEAVRALDLRYVAPPASFEQRGQRVRNHADVLAGLGTCLDLTVLFAALLEQAGLRPIVVVVEGHAFAGAWLTDSPLPRPTTDDPALLRKRLGIGEAVVFDSSPVTAGIPFGEAARRGEAHLVDTDDFLALIDVHACRLVEVRPLALEPVDDSLAQAPAREVSRERAALPEDRFEDDTLDATTRTRLHAWRSKLLDLTLRNRLLNLKETRSTVRLTGLDLGALEDQLDDGERFTLHARPDQREAGAEAVTDEAVRAHQGRRELLVDLTEGELDKRVTELYRRSRSTVQESGAHTLYLALGVLSWRESPGSEIARLAPLILLPVSLERRSRGGYALVRADEEEARINATLLEKLRKDFGIEHTGLDPLPTDEHGIDVAAVFRRARRAVVDLDRWDVHEHAWLGQFAFTKHLMWLDLLANLDALLGNPVVEHLLGGGVGSFPLATELVPLGAVDTDRAPGALVPVVPADPSQLQAVIAARDGSSFVLQGPPGTGKSQTITNLIAQLLGEGKTVLFVSEKRAALEVVQRRLDAIGLGPYCLELHSHKSSKKQVIAQLGASFQAAATAPSVGWTRHAEDLADTRAQLDAHAHRLAANSPFGGPVRDVMAELIGLADAPRVALPALAWSTLDEAAVDALDERIATLDRRLADVEPLAEHPWRDVGQTAWTPTFSREIVDAARALSQACAATAHAAQTARSALHLSEGSDSTDDIEVLVDAARAVLHARPAPSALVHDPDPSSRFATIRAWIAQGRALDADRRALLDRWTEPVLRLPLDELEARFQRWSGAFFLFAFFALWGARGRLRAVARGELPVNSTITADLSAAIHLRDQIARLRDQGTQATRWLGAAWQGERTDWSDAQAVVDRAEVTRAALRTLAQHEGTTLAGLGPLADAATEPDALPPATRAALTALVERWTALHATRDRWAQIARTDPPAGPLHAVAERLDRAVSAPGRLKPWCAAREAMDRARDLGLGPLIDALIVGDLPRAGLTDAWRRTALESWWEAHLEREPALATFRGVEHRELVRRFHELDDRALALGRDEIAARIAARVPDLYGPGDGLGLVRRQLQLQRRHLPVRQLFAKIGPVLKRIKPCALMSPLSVAQYLDPSLPGYDVVVFDEASQIPPWDAVGAIARGEQVVVVGDSKQLPPTRFFDAGGDDDEVLDEDEIGETESILDEVVAAGLRELRLRWHYRSEHESLIAFSNHLYYDNALHTFPSALHEGLGVELREVPDGYYDRGRSRTNRGEAEAVVAEMLALLALPDDRRPTVGVVTFSMAQQRLVQDLVDAALRDRPELAYPFSDDHPEPAFIKNLESVQGDERDVMLFTIGYGPDRTGKVTMNFGPLNRRGGERRLNVAVTRARKRLIVFSTLRADQIDLLRTRAVGVAHLKHFLAYADQGMIALDRAATVRHNADFDSPFERQVHDVLVRAGHTVHKQVGVSGYRIDLAVVDPDAPGRYLLAVECDGATYHSAHGARERDKLREAVLTGLGWQVHRVWSTDWWYERAGTQARLLQAVRDAIDAPRHTAPVSTPLPDPAVPTHERSHGDPTADDVPELELDDEPSIDDPAHDDPAHDDPPDVAVYDPLARLGDDVPAAPWPERASLWTPPTCEASGDRDDFYSATARPALARTLRRLVDVHGPVLTDDVYRAIATAWGFGRLGSRIRQTLDTARTALPPAERPVVRGEHLWPAALDPDVWRGFRYVDADSERDPAQISAEEVANAASWVLERGVSMSRDALAREVADIFGASQLGTRIRDTMEAGIAVMIARGEARADGADRLTVVGGGA